MSPTSVSVNWVEPAPMNAIFAIGPQRRRSAMPVSASRSTRSATSAE